MSSLSNDERWETTFPESAEFAMVPKELFAQCSVNAICVYAALAMYRNYATNMCWPSQSRLAVNVRLSKSTVKRALNELCELGVVEKRTNYNEHGGLSSCTYLLCAPWSTGEPSPRSTSDPRHGSQMTCKQEETNNKNINDTFRESEELFNAVCKATSIDLRSITKAQKKKIDLVVAGLCEVNATSEEIYRRAKRMESSWNTGKVTPNSLLTHWASFAEQAKPEYGIRASRDAWDIDENGNARPRRGNQGV